VAGDEEERPRRGVALLGGSGGDHCVDGLPSYWWQWWLASLLLFMGFATAVCYAGFVVEKSVARALLELEGTATWGTGRRC
jgi:hypothetical protein